MTAIDNEDWLKYRTWDMYRGSTRITTVDDLLWALSVLDESLEDQKAAVQHFMTLPAWNPAPAELVSAVADFLVSTMKAAGFDPSEPRDDKGDWTSGGGGGGDDSGKPTGGTSLEPAITPTPSGDLAKMTPDELSAHMSDVITRQTNGLESEVDTLHLHDMVDGVVGKYTADRQEQQQMVIDGFLNAPGVESNHQLLIMAGLPGSGKTTFLNGSLANGDRPAVEGHAQQLGIDVKSYVNANPDDVGMAMKAAGMVPDYGALGLTPQEIDTFIQEEKSSVAREVVAQASAQGKNIIIDSTMKSDAQFSRYVDVVNEMADSPYHTTMILIDATKEQSIEHATGRYQRGGRFTPLSNIANMPLNDSGQTPPRVTFDNNSDKVDRAILVSDDRQIISDTKPSASGPPTLIADGSPTLGAPTDGAAFSASFEAAFKDNPYTAFVNHYTPEEIQNEGMKPLTSNNGQTGLLIHDHGDGRIEATALYNVSDTPGAGRALLQDSVANHGVNYVECFGEGLRDIYQTVGFQVDTTSSFDPQYAPKDWNYEKFGTPDYYTMKIPT